MHCIGLHSGNIVPRNLVKLTLSALYSRSQPLLDVLSMCSCEGKFLVGGCALDSTLWYIQRRPAHCVTHILISIIAGPSRGVLTPLFNSAGEVFADAEPSSPDMARSFTWRAIGRPALRSQYVSYMCQIAWCSMRVATAAWNLI